MQRYLAHVVAEGLHETFTPSILLDLMYSLVRCAWPIPRAVAPQLMGCQISSAQVCLLQLLKNVSIIEARSTVHMMGTWSAEARCHALIATTWNSAGPFLQGCPHTTRSKTESPGSAATAHPTV